MKLNEEGLNAELLPQLKLFKCHKVVRAGKISALVVDGDNGLLLIDVDGIKQPFAVPLDFMQRHAPEIGGYLVVYEDGYLSFSPADVFEAGYHELPPLGTACGGISDGAPAFINKTAQVPLSTEAQPLWYGVDLAAADFSDALMWLKEGKRVQRAGWNGAGQWIEMMVPDNIEFTFPARDYDLVAFFGLKNAQGKFVPGWTPSTGDLMADDWQVVS